MTHFGMSSPENIARQLQNVYNIETPRKSQIKNNMTDFFSATYPSFPWGRNGWVGPFDKKNNQITINSERL